MIKMSLLCISLLSVLYADKIEFKNGAVLEGKVSAQDSQTATIIVNGKSTTYGMKDIKNIEMTRVAPPPPAVAMPPKPIDAQHNLILDAGAVLHVQTTTQVDSARYSAGQQFTMKLVNDVVNKNGETVIKKGSTVYAHVVSSKQAGRLVGESQLIITISGVEIDAKRVTLKTNNINVLTQSRQGKDSAGKVLRGAAIGALINGRDGARDGAKVGVGAAVLTRGRPSGIPAGALLDFSTLETVKI